MISASPQLSTLCFSLNIFLQPSANSLLIVAYEEEDEEEDDFLSLPFSIHFQRKFLSYHAVFWKTKNTQNCAFVGPLIHSLLTSSFSLGQSVFFCNILMFFISDSSAGPLLMVQYSGHNFRALFFRFYSGPISME